MSGHFPKLDEQALRRLRTLVKQLHADNGSSVQLPKLLEIANQFRSDTGLTVDLDAAQELGQPPLLVVRAAPTPQYPAWAGQLSSREREVTELIAAGLPNKAIAACLFISLATVKDHVHNILSKAGLSGRAALIAQWPSTYAGKD
jgi:DNA-binding NarL/FixJ family response regulator